MLAQKTGTRVEEQESFPDRAKKSTARVLVVDDEKLVRWSVTEALRARGFEALEACDAASAIRTFDRRCDLVLLDLHLPDANDLRVLSFIRAQAPTLPVIVMTAFATREIVDEAAALGAAVINKPFDLGDLTRTVERTLDGRLY